MDKITILNNQLHFSSCMAGYQFKHTNNRHQKWSKSFDDVVGNSEYFRRHGCLGHSIVMESRFAHSFCSFHCNIERFVIHAKPRFFSGGFFDRRCTMKGNGPCSPPFLSGRIFNFDVAEVVQIQNRPPTCPARLWHFQWSCWHRITRQRAICGRYVAR